MIAPAVAGTITFDDVTNTGHAVLNGYGGFNWNNFLTLDTTTAYTTDGYGHGTVSLNNVAFNGFASAATISSATPFRLTGGYLTGAWNDGLKVKLVATRAGHAVYTQTFVVNTVSPTLETFNRSIVDKVVFTSGGGTTHPGPSSGSQFALDNLSFSRVVPEPSVWAMMIGGFGLVGGSMRRRGVRIGVA
nr:PEPxxWA-CTERM sorting domain-containing protein [Polymorphobacter sp.]